MEYLHTMVRIGEPDASLRLLLNKMGIMEVRRIENEKGRYTLVFLAAHEDVDTAAEHEGAPGRAHL